MLLRSKKRYTCNKWFLFLSLEFVDCSMADIHFYCLILWKVLKHLMALFDIQYSVHHFDHNAWNANVTISEHFILLCLLSVCSVIAVQKVVFWNKNIPVREVYLLSIKRDHFQTNTTPFLGNEGHLTSDRYLLPFYQLVYS